MKITFYSNFLNHHQLPFCLEMYKRLGKDFTFVSTEMIPEERLKLGYEDMNDKYSFVLTTYQSQKNYEKAILLGEESDVVIIGSAPDIFIKERLKHNKLTFRYSERVLKKGRYRILDPRVFISLIKNHTRYRKRNLYMLCASAYTAADFRLVGAYRKKTYKWGYFPEVKDYKIEQLMKKKQHTVPKILWVGRLLDLKQPEDAIKVAHMLKSNGYSFQMNIIGTGYMELTLKKLIKEYNLSKEIKMLGNMPPEEVRKYMEESNIFMFTSDFNEGWGAVLNEAMNSGCAVVASHAIGSVPFLIKNKKNGLIYKNGDIKNLYSCVKELIDTPEWCNQLGEEAYNTLKDIWNAKFATDRLERLINALLTEEKVQFTNGPCSKAEILNHKYRY